MSEKIAIILVRSIVGAKPDVRTTLDRLNLKVKNACVLANNTPETRGMLQVIKDYVTWGKIDADTKKLLDKRGKDKRFYRLAPPRKGYGPRGIKVPFGMNGALGDRKEKINNLISRMV